MCVEKQQLIRPPNGISKLLLLFGSRLYSRTFPYTETIIWAHLLITEQDLYLRTVAASQRLCQFSHQIHSKQAEGKKIEGGGREELTRAERCYATRHLFVFLCSVVMCYRTVFIARATVFEMQAAIINYPPWTAFSRFQRFGFNSKDYRESIYYKVTEDCSNAPRIMCVSVCVDAAGRTKYRPSKKKSIDA